LLFLALLWRDKRYKVIFMGWFLAMVFGLFMLPAYFPRVEAAQLRSVIQIGMGLLFAAGLIFLLWLRNRRNNSPLQLDKHHPDLRVLWVLVIGILFFYPWLAWGAFGSLLDTLLQFVTGLVFGIDAAILSEFYLLRPIREASISEFIDTLLGVVSTGIALLIMTSETGFPFGAIQLILVLSLPVMSCGIAGLFQHHEKDRTIANIIALAIGFGLSFAAPLMPPWCPLLLAGS
jgi:hypothetical protein